MLKHLSNNIRRRFRMALILMTSAMVFVLFQNFTPIPLSELTPHLLSDEAKAASARDGSADMRDLAPDRPSDTESAVLVAPNSGNDLNSISHDWLGREAHLLSGGADEKVLADINKRMNNLVKGADSDTDGVSRGPASEDSKNKDEKSWGMQPTSMKLTAINRIEFGLANQMKIACTYQGDSMRVDLTKPLSQRMDLNLRHDSSQNSSSLHLNYNW